jgi:putative spermidine/putrescine transport system ATP-binding protein
MNPVGAHLRIVGMTVIYDGKSVAVRGIDLDISPGEFVTLLGPSGSGKTSVLKAIAGFVQPADGRVLADGRNLLELPSNERNLGMVFQDYALFPHMSVAENIAFPLKMRRRKKQEIDVAVRQALQMVKLDGYETRKPTQLSGGEQQRVALARATIFDPPVLLMDEPLGALDKQLREQLQDELKSIQRRTGITTLYVTHDQSEAMTLSDRIAVMREGSIEQIGTPEDLYERPGNRFVAEFVGESNFITGSLRVDGNQPVLETTSGWHVPLSQANGHSAGDRIEVVIRPERFSIDDPAVDSQVNAEVLEQTYTGEMIRLKVKLPTGEQLLVKEQNRGQAADYHAGKQVWLGWSHHDMTVLRG